MGRPYPLRFVTADPRGTVDQLWRFPVKSMQGERVDRVEVTPTGVAGDRAFGVIDTASGRVLSAKRVPALLEAAAAVDGTAVKVTLPDGTVYEAGDPALDGALSTWLGTEVSLQRASDDVGGTYEMGSDPTDDSAPTFEFTGPPGSFADLAAVHVLTSASVAAAAELHPDGQWDVRRFRPTAFVTVAGEGFVEDGWIGATLALGSARIEVLMPTVRCAMPTRAQPGGLGRDLEVVRTLNRHHDGNLGVYCRVAAPGPVAVGDTVAPA